MTINSKEQVWFTVENRQIFLFSIKVESTGQTVYMGPEPGEYRVMPNKQASPNKLNPWAFLKHPKDLTPVVDCCVDR